MSPEATKAAIHVLDDRVEALRQQRPQLASDLERAYAALRQAISDISVGVANADKCREAMPEIKRAYTQAVANWSGHQYSLEDVAREMKWLARQVVEG